MSESSGILRSRESNIRSFVRFTNCSQRQVEIFWINFQGVQVHYTTLNPTGSCVINTYVTHPWIFLDKNSGERLCIRNKDVFQPSPWFKFIANLSGGQVSVNREELMIHIKLKPLREICLWQINFLLRSKSDISSLQIPRCLKNDMLHIFHLSTRYREEEEPEENSNSSSD